jgi:hypothetical protein
MDSAGGYPTNVVPFPVRYPSSETSVVTTRHSALDICYSVYGEGPITPEVLDNYYEANASESCQSRLFVSNHLIFPKCKPLYSNFTAHSRLTIPYDMQVMRIHLLQQHRGKL